MKINVLHLVPSLSAGGVESLVVALWENIDRQKFKFEIAVLNANDPMHQKGLEKLGAQIHFIANAGSRSSLLSKITWRLRAIRNFYKLLTTNPVDVLHCHYYNMYGPFVIVAALKGVPVRIVHAHAVALRDTFFSRLSQKVYNFLNFNFLVTEEIGCSNAAVKWFFGSSHYQSRRSKTLYNGIDMARFTKPDEAAKQRLRKYWQLQQGTHFIHVGRFTTDKNDLFLIRLFYEMTRKKQDLYLNIIGYGPFEQQMKELISSLNIKKRVRFYSSDSNVPEILSAMDYFLLPSLREGMSIVAIESQCSGVPIFISDKVTREVDLGLAVYLPIDKGPGVWAEEILDRMNNGRIPRKLNPEKMKQFDIKYTVSQVERLYTGEEKQAGIEVFTKTRDVVVQR